MVFLRLGKIPGNKQSTNFFTNEKEIGVSVFEFKNNLPILSNLNQLNSFALRREEPAFICSGDVIGIGNDEEPLIKNIKIIKSINYSKEDFLKIILDKLNQAFLSKSGDLDLIDRDLSRVFHSVKRTKTCTICKIEIDEFDNCDCKSKKNTYKYTKGKEIHEYIYAGIKFTNPVNGFDTLMGWKNKVAKI